MKVLKKNSSLDRDHLWEDVCGPKDQSYLSFDLGQGPHPKENEKWNGLDPLSMASAEWGAVFIPKRRRLLRPYSQNRASSYNVDNRKKTIFLPNSSSLFSLSSSLSLSRVCFFAVISICTNRNTGISGGVVDCLNSGALFSGDLVFCFTDCDQFELICWTLESDSREKPIGHVYSRLVLWRSRLPRLVAERGQDLVSRSR